MPGVLRVSEQILIPERELSWRFSRSSGPGGQSVNTTDSRAELSLDLLNTSALSAHLRERAMQRLAGRLTDGVLTVTAQEHRSQLQNREACEKRMIEILAQAVAPPPPRRRATRPSRSARERRVAGKRLRGEVKRGRSGSWEE